MKKLWIIASLMLVVVTGCGGPQPSYSNSTENNDNDSGGMTNSNNSEINIAIPSNNEAAPSGVLDQLAWAGGGGDALGSCPSTGCSIYWQGNTLLLRGFQSRENLTLLFYRESGFDSCGNSTADYVTSNIVQVDANGYLQVTISGLDSNILLYQILDADSGELLIGMPLGGKIPC